MTGNWWQWAILEPQAETHLAHCANLTNRGPAALQDFDGNLVLACGRRLQPERISEYVRNPRPPDPCVDCGTVMFLAPDAAPTRQEAPA